MNFSFHLPHINSIRSISAAPRGLLSLPAIVLILLVATNFALVRQAHAFSVFSLKGSGNIVRESRHIEGIKFLRLETGARVGIIQGTKESLDIEIDDNLQPYVQINFRDGKLTIEDEKSLKSDRFKITIYTKNIESIATGGSTAVHADSLTVAKLQISTGRSSAVNINQLKAEKLSVDLGGSSVVKVRGEADEFSAALGGSSVLSAGHMLAKSANVQTGASAHASVWVATSLSAQSSGSSVLRYRGKPKLTKSVSGSSSIEAAE